ncbi:hypothetical protein NDU88_006727 [Pleurodeles waltl]|uniref:Uncharacterized protein n=1 Tax=Pleurodeles waltl TaxID=8319 RepID=A0AAV7PJ87_PLEWA|nr:hypothetical protein NDU88_006727 [Pleurodeles waltl]
MRGAGGHQQRIVSSIMDLIVRRSSRRRGLGVEHRPPRLPQRHQQNARAPKLVVRSQRSGRTAAAQPTGPVSL